MSKLNKFIIWCASVAVTSFWMWVSVDIWLQRPLFELQNAGNFIILGSLFVVLASFLSVGLIMFRDRLWSVYLGLIVGITYLLNFGISNLNLVGVFILVLLFYHAQDIVQGEIVERIKMNSRLLIRKSLSNFLVAFFILISFAAYQSPAIENFKGQEKIPSSGEVFIRNLIQQTFVSQIDEASPKEKEVITNHLTAETVSRLNTFLAPYFEYMPPALAFGLFLVLWGVGWIFLWLAVFLGVLVFFILRKLNFIKIEEYDVKAERLII